ncbi:MAG TPA: pyridoxamine 5'-phosphate oxidase family protein [Polyangiaceae bacterium]|nr:pyridoxamine 5'-phosphate oxidase family protein [Polyangiaceae bacterium]
MGKLYTEIDDKLREFILAQQLFFVATAPLEEDGHLNLSPKGLAGIRVLAPTRVAYLDYVGSGVETIAHLNQNGRIVLMFCAFEGPPKIVRLHGRGRVVEAPDPGFGQIAENWDSAMSARAIIIVDVERISDSCGYGVPLYGFKGERDQLLKWAERKGPEAVRNYQVEKNAASIDGLPGLHWVQGESRRKT